MHPHAASSTPTSRLAGLAPHAKLAAAVLTALGVVATPRTAVWAFLLDGLLVAGVAVLAGVGRTHLRAARHVLVPVAVFAVLLPFFAVGERVEVVGLHVSEPGLWGAWNVVAKAVLGLGLGLALAASTSVADLARGLERLRAPGVVVAIIVFMARYVEVVADDLRRLQVARVARGDDPRWPWQARAVAGTAGTLFVRSYERGERVHLAMRARGHGGTELALGAEPAPRRDWAVALCLPAVVWSIAAVALVTT